MDGRQDDLYQKDLSDSSENNFEDYSLGKFMKVLENVRDDIPLLLTAVLTRTRLTITPRITITRNFRYRVMPEYLVLKFKFWVPFA